MAEADPNNELGHFSLGKAYLDAGQTAPAIQSFQRVIDLNPDIAKVYQLLATALLKENRKPEAIDRLTQGVSVATARGDLMPKNEMIQMLKDLGAPVPESAVVAPQQAVGQGQVLCNRCGKVGRRLPEPVFSNAQGKLDPGKKICTRIAGANGSAWGQKSSMSCVFRCPTPRRRKYSTSTCASS